MFAGAPVLVRMNECMYVRRYRDAYVQQMDVCMYVCVCVFVFFCKCVAYLRTAVCLG
jgi:hypothetical protein